MDERRQGAVAGTGRPGAPAAGAAVGRRYPKPPRLWWRLLHLCFRPESWAEAARYPFWVTLVALIFAVIIGAFTSSYGISRDAIHTLQVLGQNYDANYSTLEVNDAGVMSVKGEWKGPIHLGNLVIDPTGKTDLESLPPATTLMTAKSVSTSMGIFSRESTIAGDFPWLVPEKGSVTTVDGSYITGMVRRWRPLLLSVLWVVMFAWKLLCETVWVVVTLYLVAPLVVIGAATGGRALMIPRRVAYRIAAAVLVPLVIFSGILQAVGYSASGALGEEGALILWCAAASAMAVWAGVMARRMYVPAKPQERRP